MTTNDGRVQSQFRIPGDLYEWLRAEARRQNRSINAHVVHLIQAARTEAAK